MDQHLLQEKGKVRASRKALQENIIKIIITTKKTNGLVGKRRKKMIKEEDLTTTLSITIQTKVRHQATENI